MDDATRRIMRHVMSKKLATQYNWFGRGKLPFKDLRMYDAIRSEYFVALNEFLFCFTKLRHFVM